MRKNIVISVFIFIFCIQYSLSQLPTISFGNIEKIAEGFQFVEGPVWIDGVGLLFSDIPANIVYRWDSVEGVSEYINPSGNSNGLALDSDGNILLAQHGSRQLGRLDDKGNITTLASHFKGKRLNSPNDITVKSDGSIYFTDPPYGINSAQEELGFYGIYSITPSGKLYLLDKSLNRPNGIALSLDETILYVGDSEERTIYIWDIINDSTINNKRKFAFMDATGYTDGMKIDKYGHLFSSGPIGIWIYTPDGGFIETIAVPGQTTNCCWGDTDRQTLFITSGNAVYRLRVNYSNTQSSSIINDPFQRKKSEILNIIPNPAKDNANIIFELKRREKVKINIYTSTGTNINTLVNKELPRGKHSVTWQVDNSPSGVYIVRLISSKGNDYKRCIVN